MMNGRELRTEVIPEVVFLGKLVDRILAGKIRVPRFQRGFVWKQADLHALLDSVSRGFPIGSILVWETGEDIETTQYIGPVEIRSSPGRVIDYLLDGQQRVSTLVGTLRLPKDAQATINGVDWRLYCDLENREFTRAPTKLEPWHFPVNSLLSTAGFFDECRRMELSDPSDTRLRKWLREADLLATSFRDYQLPLIRIREADIDSAVTVFARLNRRGRKMAADEMVSALTYKQGTFHLARRLDKFRDELDGKGFGNLDRVLLLRAVLAALDRDIYAKDWADLMVKSDVRSRLPSGFDLATEGIRRAIEFVKYELGVSSDRLLPYGLQIVLLGEFFRLCPEPAKNVIELLERWFWVTSFSGWFGGRSSTQVTRALRELRDLSKGETNEIQVVDLNAPALPFPERFDSRSARVRAFMIYLASLRPRSFQNEELNLGGVFASSGTRAMRYVLSNVEQLPKVYSSPANRMFVHHTVTGQTIGGLEDLDDATLKEILPTHGFPNRSLELLRRGDRVGLIETRLESLIVGERKWLEERRVTLPMSQTGDVIADSDTSQDDD